MSLQKIIKEYLENEINSKQAVNFERVNRKLPYKDVMISTIKNSEKKVEDFSWWLNIDKRTLNYIMSKTGRKRDIKFIEALRFAVIANFSLADSIDFLNICNFGLNFDCPRDKCVLLVLAYHHTNEEELERRLKCLNIIDNDLSDDSFKKCIEKLNRLK